MCMEVGRGLARRGALNGKVVGAMGGSGARKVSREVGEDWKAIVKERCEE
jgi:hypothetical protein